MSEHLQAAHHAQEAAVAVAKVTPPVAATGMTLAGYPLADWLILVTILYTVLQIAVLAHKWYLQHINKCNLPHSKQESDDG